MSETFIKIRCTACAGKIGIEEEYYRELVGRAISCPHCQAEMLVPANPAKPGETPSGAPPGVDVTQEINRPEAPSSIPKPRSGERRTCPFCGDEIGPRDRVCIRCGNTLC
jgi:hypothetical protein